MAAERIGDLEKFFEFYKKYGASVIGIKGFEVNGHSNPHITSFEIWSERAGVAFIGFGAGGVGLVKAFFSTMTGTFEVNDDTITFCDPDAVEYKSVSFKVNENQIFAEFL